jgi:hypothetical protein
MLLVEMALERYLGKLCIRIVSGIYPARRSVLLPSGSLLEGRHGDVAGNSLILRLKTEQSVGRKRQSSRTADCRRG